MRRVIFCMLIYIVCLVLSGCVSTMHGLPHPHSELTAPTFCAYEGLFRLESERHEKPLSIYYVSVDRYHKINDEPFDWNKWMEYHGLSQVWEIEYAPDGKSDPPDRRFSCITYGQVPPGYIEKIPAEPLIPEQLYSVLLRSWGLVFFVIRADSMGRPTHLEYAIDSPLPGSRTGGVHVITRK